MSIVFLVLFASCQSATRSNEAVTVPDDEKIPDFSNEYVLVRKSSPPGDFEGLPSLLQSVHRYLSSPETARVDTLDFQHSGEVRVGELGRGRLAILDVRRFELREYDLITGRARSIAGMGEGPGELMFARDLLVDGTKLFVPSRRSMRVFDCAATPCAYDHSFTTGVSVRSIARTSMDSLAVTGSAPITDATGLTVSTDGLRAVHLLNTEGNRGLDFGSVYDTEGQWMLIQPLVDDSRVIFLETAGEFVVAFGRFPLLYVYDRSGKLVNTYRVDDFTIGRQQYWPATGQLEIPFGRLSTLRISVVPNSDTVLLEVASWTNRRADEQDAPRNAVRDYYALDIASGQSWYLGATEGESPGRLILLSDLLLVETGGVLLNVIM